MNQGFHRWVKQPPDRGVEVHRKAFGRLYLIDELAMAASEVEHAHVGTEILREEALDEHLPDGEPVRAHGIETSGIYRLEFLTGTAHRDSRHT